MANHGSRTRYTAGCRCVECRAENARYRRERSHQERTHKWLSNLTPDERARIIEGIGAIMQREDGDYVDRAKEILDWLESERRRSVLANRKPGKGPTHGKPSTYSVYGCRCEICSTNYLAWKAARRSLSASSAGETRR